MRRHLKPLNFPPPRLRTKKVGNSSPLASLLKLASGYGLPISAKTWVDESDVEEELEGLLKEIEDEQFLDEIGEMGKTSSK